MCADIDFRQCVQTRDIHAFECVFRHASRHVFRHVFRLRPPCSHTLDSCGHTHIYVCVYIRPCVHACVVQWHSLLVDDLTFFCERCQKLKSGFGYPWAQGCPQSAVDFEVVKTKITEHNIPSETRCNQMARCRLEGNFWRMRQEHESIRIQLFSLADRGCSIRASSADELRS